MKARKHQRSLNQPARTQQRRAFFEQLEKREVFAPLPVLMVIADQRDFFYQEYGDTKLSLEEAGLSVQVAATTTRPSTPHSGSGEPTSGGVVTPALPLSAVEASDYSAIVFVGGWGSSMYQYAVNANYYEARYNGDPATKAIVNNLINDFVDQDKYVTAICHATTVLAYARVDGVSPVAGKLVATPQGGATGNGGPGGFINGQNYNYFELAQRTMMEWNGAVVSPSMSIGNPYTSADDVVVDGRIITAQDNFSARAFGRVIGERLISEDVPPPPPPPVNHAPQIASQDFQLAENSPLGTTAGLVIASDPDAGQTLSYAIVGGNTNAAFAIDSVTGRLNVAFAGAIDFETTPLFQLTIRVTDSGNPALASEATVTVHLQDVNETPPGPVYRLGNNVIVQGTAGTDYIYIWSSGPGQVMTWIAGQCYGPYALASSGRVVVYGGDGTDYIYATDSYAPVTIYGEGGHDLITGGYANDIIDGGAGYDRISGMGGDDQLFGGANGSILDGGAGNDLLVGGSADDRIYGRSGNDVLIGGDGHDYLDGGAGEDLLIGRATSYDVNLLALQSLFAEWNLTGLAGNTRQTLTAAMMNDGLNDCLIGGDGDDWLAVLAGDCSYQ